MGALQQSMNEKRMILPELELSIGANGVREGDEFSLELIGERRRKMKLTRTKYIFSMEDKFAVNYISSELTLPSFNGEKGSFEMKLIPGNGRAGIDGKARYLFRSLEQKPFKLNGNFCFEAFVERGDIVDLGFNRLHFLKAEHSLGDSIAVPENFLTSDLPVLLEGETGTGKTTLARKIHEASGRRGAFVHLNLSAFSKGLIESELFGHVKGAFTGAINSKKGAILEAHKGTLFLDEIDSLTLDLQTKLLLFLDDYQVRMVGGESTQKADVRIIFASGSQLKKLVDSEKMRKDFYFRLKAGYSLNLPSLRGSEKIIRKICEEFECEHMVKIDQALMAFYLKQDWPGNIRQLRSHLMKKKIAASGKKIIFGREDEEMAAERALPRELSELESLEMVKVSYCYSTYMKLGQNLAKTAEVLELSTNTLKAYLAKKDKLRNDNVIDINL